MVIKLASNEDEAYYWRGISYEGTGRQHEAISDYRQFLALSQNSRLKEDVEQRLFELDKGKQTGPSNPGFIPDSTQNTNQAEGGKIEQDFDLYDVITALGERALNSIWLGRGVACYGENAEELLSLADQGRHIKGQDFLRIASGISQTRAGDFAAFDPDSAFHWILIRAWEGSGFYLEIDDLRSKERLMAHFQAVEEVEGASPPYEGLFISKLE
jgi:hypothetical protein